MKVLVSVVSAEAKELVIHKSRGYTVIQNSLIRDYRLSPQALGVFVRILSLPDNWDYSIKGLLAIFNQDPNKQSIGKKAIYRILDEIEDCNYIIRTQDRNHAGRFSKVQYHIFEEALSDARRLEIEAELEASNHLILRTRESVNLTSDDMLSDIDTEAAPSFEETIVQNSNDDLTEEESIVENSEPEETQDAELDLTESLNSPESTSGDDISPDKTVYPLNGIPSKSHNKINNRINISTPYPADTSTCINGVVQDSEEHSQVPYSKAELREAFAELCGYSLKAVRDQDVNSCKAAFLDLIKKGFTPAEVVLSWKIYQDDFKEAGKEKRFNKQLVVYLNDFEFAQNFLLRARSVFSAKEKERAQAERERVELAFKELVPVVRATHPHEFAAYERVFEKLKATGVAWLKADTKHKEEFKAEYQRVEEASKRMRDRITQLLSTYAKEQALDEAVCKRAERGFSSEEELER